MNFRKEFNNILSEIKQIEGRYAERVKNGSQNPNDYHNMSYFNGMHNGFNFVWYILDNDVTTESFEKMKRDLLFTGDVVVEGTNEGKESV